MPRNTACVHPPVQGPRANAHDCLQPGDVARWAPCPLGPRGPRHPFSSPRSRGPHAAPRVAAPELALTASPRGGHRGGWSRADREGGHGQEPV